MRKILVLAALLAVALTACSSKNAVSGVFQGKAEGMRGDMAVEVLLEKGKISAVTVTQNADTPVILGVGAGKSIVQLPGDEGPLSA